MLLLGIEHLTIRLEVQCLNQSAIWSKILFVHKFLNKKTSACRGIFAVYTINSL